MACICTALLIYHFFDWCLLYVLPLLCSQHVCQLYECNFNLGGLGFVCVGGTQTQHKNSHLNNYFVSYGLLPLCHSNINYCYIWCYNNPFSRDFILFLGFLKVIVFSFGTISCAAAPFNNFFFCFFTLLLVSEQFILPFSYFFLWFFTQLSFSIDIFFCMNCLHGGSNTLVDFTGREMIWMQLRDTQARYTND